MRNPQLFPPEGGGQVYENRDGDTCFSFGVDDGITLRDLLAGMAMQGVLSNPEYAKILGQTNASSEHIASIAADQADALLAELEKKA